MSRGLLAAFALALALSLAAGCGGGDGALELQGNPDRGEELVGASDEGIYVQMPVEPQCALCHTLAEAEFAGVSAPNLDAIQPGYQRVLDAIREGPGAMPSYDDLDEEDLHDIAAYVSQAASPAGGGP